MMKNRINVLKNTNAPKSKIVEKEEIKDFLITLLKKQ